MADQIINDCPLHIPDSLGDFGKHGKLTNYAAPLKGGEIKYIPESYVPRMQQIIDEQPEYFKIKGITAIVVMKEDDYAAMNRQAFEGLPDEMFMSPEDVKPINDSMNKQEKSKNQVKFYRNEANGLIVPTENIKEDAKIEIIKPGEVIDMNPPKKIYVIGGIK